MMIAAEATDIFHIENCIKLTYVVLIPLKRKQCKSDLFAIHKEKNIIFYCFNIQFDI